jgi:predicted nucleotidyltransferase
LDILKTKIKNYFLSKEQVISVDLFGSFAKSLERADSDIDIAILCDKKNVPTKFDILSWRQDLNDLLGLEVDLVCLNNVSPILGMQVAQDRVNILLKDEKTYSLYIMYLYSDYAELKELRAPMEKEILTRKYYDK